MTPHRTITFALILILSSTAAAQAVPPAPRVAVANPLPKDLEIQLALSALPRNLRDNATVYVLNPATGFEVARQGSNGFHAFVARTGDDTFRGTWPLKAYRDDVLYPISFDDAGSKANMRVFMDAAKMQASGTAPEELKKLMQQRLGTHYYPLPSRAGVSYMMSPILRTYTNPDQTNDVDTASVPHVMHYVPNLSNADVGAAAPKPEALAYFAHHGHWQDTPDPMVINSGPHGYMVQFLGVTERAAIVKEYAAMLSRLCQIRKDYCLPR